MRLLVDTSYSSILLGNNDDALVLHRYAHRVLIDCASVPSEIPFHAWQRIDDKPLMVNGVSITLNDAQFHYADNPRTLLKFIGPISPIWLQQLKAHGVRYCFFCPPYGMCAEVPDRFRSAKIQDVFPFICSAAPYSAAHCSRGLSRDRDKMKSNGLMEDVCDVVFFRREDRARVAAELVMKNVEVLGNSNYKLRVRYSSSLSDLRKVSGVKLADYSRPIQLCTVDAVTDGVNQDLNVAVARPKASIDGSELRGKDQVIAVADTGLDTGLNDASLHADFQGRVKAIVSLPLNNSWKEVAVNTEDNDGAADRNSGHGTHVAGLALGNGTRSAGLHQGVAPEAQLVFQAIEQYVEIKNDYRSQFGNGYYLSGRPLDIAELFEQAREFGARIHVNAWGDEARGAYTDDCYESDTFLRENPDALVLFAAGNAGKDLDGNRVLDKQSLFSPASAKNVLAIGATEGGLENVGLRVKWDAFDANGKRFRSSADRADAISGESQRIALFSSTGPSQDGRIKPDVCAPGTNLVAPRSRSFSGKGWGLASPLPYYMYNGGTSMAVGVAGGAAAVLREAWHNQNGQPPSGQALKALMILSTSPIISRLDELPEPSYVGGFGRIQIAQALPKTPNQKITLIDERDNGMMTGEDRDYPVRINQRGILRAVLSWYDPPGESLINNLNLSLIEPSGDRVWGNHLLGERGEPDGVNNVQAITVEDMPLGHYVLRISAMNVPMGPQSFALTVSQPVGLSLNLPLRYLRGIGVRFNQYFVDAGIQSIGQLLDQPNKINEISGISKSVRQQISARLSVLTQVQDAISKITFEENNISVNKLLNGKRPAAFSDVLWQSLKTQCVPLILVFNKRALSRVVLEMLLR